MKCAKEEYKLTFTIVSVRVPHQLLHRTFCSMGKRCCSPVSASPLRTTHYIAHTDIERCCSHVSASPLQTTHYTVHADIDRVGARQQSRIKGLSQHSRLKGVRQQSRLKGLRQQSRLKWFGMRHTGDAQE